MNRPERPSTHCRAFWLKSGVCPPSPPLCHTQLSTAPLIPAGPLPRASPRLEEAAESLSRTLEGALLQWSRGRKNSSFCLHGTVKGRPTVPFQRWQPLANHFEGASRGRRGVGAQQAPKDAQGGRGDTALGWKLRDTNGGWKGPIFVVLCLVPATPLWRGRCALC